MGLRHRFHQAREPSGLARRTCARTGLGTATGEVTTLAGGLNVLGDGTGTAAGFRFPVALACDGAGVAYVADQGNNTIR